MDCDYDEQGNRYCKKFKTTKNSKLSTGSEATIALDRKTCKTSFINRFSVLEEDEKDFQRIAKKMEADCNGGVQ